MPTDDTAERAPFLIASDCDGKPAVAALAAIDIVGAVLIVGVAHRFGDTVVHLVVEQCLRDAGGERLCHREVT